MNSIPRGKRDGAWSYISIPAQFLATEPLIKHEDYFTFTFSFILTWNVNETRELSNHNFELW
jgi:hypothetical protein